MKREPHSIFIKDEDGDIYSHTVYATCEAEAEQLARSIGGVYSGKVHEEICANCKAVTQMGQEKWDEEFD
jgi:hypothetical protein